MSVSTFSCDESVKSSEKGKRTIKYSEAGFTACQSAESIFQHDKPPTRLEVLGEHLYLKMEALQATLVVGLDLAKITGIFLELGEQQVLKLLQDEQLLQQSVQQVLERVPGVCRVLLQSSETVHNSEHSAKATRKECGSDHEVEERLYDEVWQLEPDLASQITGMLLEIGEPKVRFLLKSTTALKHAISQAKAAYIQHIQESQRNFAGAPKQHRDDHCSDQHLDTAQPKCYNSDCLRSTSKNQNVQSIVEERDHICRESMVKKQALNFSEVMDSSRINEEMGELVYLETSRLYSRNTAKITGMVLEMGEVRVRQLLLDTSQLQNAIHIAASSLQDSSS